jgi:hypothetical protein
MPPQDTATPRRYLPWIALVLAALILGAVGGALSERSRVAIDAPASLGPVETVVQGSATTEVQAEDGGTQDTEVEARVTTEAQVAGGATSGPGSKVTDAASLIEQIHLPDGYAIPARFGDIGRQLYAI